MVEGKDNDMGFVSRWYDFDNNAKLAFANLDLNELVLELATFDDDDPLERSSSTPTDAKIILDTKEKDRGEDNGGNDVDDTEDY